MNTSLALMAFLCAAALPYGAAAQSMYKCVENGKTTYQADPCPSAARQHTLKPPPAAAVDEAPRELAPANKRLSPIPWEIQKTIDLMAAHKVCSEAIDGWAAKVTEPYTEWLQSNKARIAKIENDRTYLAYLEEQVDVKRNGTTSICRTVSQDLRKNL